MTTLMRWSLEKTMPLFEQPLLELIFSAQQIHRQHFDPQKVQMSTLLSIKTGRCSEDCRYCAQSVRYETGLQAESMLDLTQVLAKAKQAKATGSTRFCMGAAWRHPKTRDMPQLMEMVQAVKALGMETCMTLGMLDQQQAEMLAEAGLDYYNHNLDTSEAFYHQVITTHTYQERLNTLSHVREAGIKVCAGGILGLGESVRDRALLLMQLANLPEPPESIPINQLVRVKGTPLETAVPLETFDLIRMIAVARIMMPSSMIRLSAGREKLSETDQALCFMAGANSIFYGEKLLTTPNKEVEQDKALLEKLGLTIQVL